MPKTSTRKQTTASATAPLNATPLKGPPSTPPEPLALRARPQNQAATKRPLYLHHKARAAPTTQGKRGLRAPPRKRKRKRVKLCLDLKTALESPDDFATLAHDRKVSPVADLFDLDAEECLQYLHETPVAEETWMEWVKNVNSIIHAGSRSRSRSRSR